LNFNDFYSHNKIHEHFITLRKICNGMNATNNYLRKSHLTEFCSFTKIRQYNNLCYACKYNQSTCDISNSYHHHESYTTGINTMKFNYYVPTHRSSHHPYPRVSQRFKSYTSCKGKSDNMTYTRSLRPYVRRPFTKSLRGRIHSSTLGMKS
jgi:hypothetical protein